MRVIVLIAIICFLSGKSFPQKVKNDFFVLHNIIRGDSTYNTFDKQVSLVKAAGYDGIEVNDVNSFEQMKAALDKHRFQASFFYVKVALEEPYMDSRLEAYIKQLKGSKTIISPYIVRSKSMSARSREADTLVVRLMRQLAGWANASGLQVAIYPHVNFYVERTDHAMDLVKLIDRKNLGMTFNLCHWLATTTPEERKSLQPHLKELGPYLKMFTINGANDVVSSKPVVWDDYILPLGTGSFDTYGLVRYCIRDLKLKVPVGVQCYNIKTNKYELVQNTMKVWKQYRQRLEKAE